VKKYLAYAGALALLAGIANTAVAADTTDDSLTWFGVTLYGTVDVGYTYQNRGTPLNDYFPTGLEYLVQKNASKTISTISENGMSQSKIGLRGIYEFYPGFSAIFKLETGFNPLSGNLSDGPKSIIQNNGLGQTEQNSNGDSSRAGQPFQGAAYAGVQSGYGTVTVGRQNSLLLDNILKYDPFSGSYAFSIVGYSGAAGGSGDTQDARLDNSVKYMNQIGLFRIGGQFANGAGTGSGGNALEGQLGADPLPGLSVDATYVNKKNAILAAPLGVAVKTCPKTVSTAINCLPVGLSANNTYAATVSDDWTWAVQTSYVWQQAKFFFTYEDIHFRNPQVPLAVGNIDIGGYQIIPNNDAYPKGAKILQYLYTGVKFAYTPKLDFIAAWYWIDQNNYNPAAKCPGGTADAAQCSGREDAYSLAADYKFNRHFDVYAGAMYSHLSDGLAAAPIQTTFTIDPTIGFRFNF
jgi:predicted porin